MKLTAILLFAACLQVSAKGYSQKITLSQDNVSLKQVFKEIGNQSGYQFFYKDRLIRQAENVSIHVTNATVEEALNQCLKGQPLSYSILDKIIVVKAKPNFPVAIQVSAILPAVPLNIITGTVKDQLGNPLAGVSVILQGTKKGTSTNADGSFTIDANSGEVLEFTFVGYKNKNVTVGSSNNLSVIMEVEATIGNDIVIVGYGTQKKSDLTGSVASVQSKDFVKGITTDALQLLSGKAAGVVVSQANAEPGGNLNIQIRGVGSINSSNSALIVIDGVPVGSTSNINPADIQSIEVLKDASAAAIYGTRAANGVVLITTKKGKRGPAQVSYNTYWAYQTPGDKLNVLNATQYMQYLNAISIGGGGSALFTPGQVDSAGVGTNWQDQLFRNSWATNQQISISGANDQVKYYTSLRYLNQNGIMVSSGIKQYNLLMNLEVTPSDKFKFGINLNGNLNLKDEIADKSNTGNENADPLNSAIQFDPTLSPKKNADGQYETNPSIALDNPVATAYGYDPREQNNRIYGSTFGEYQIIKGLKATIKLGGDLYNVRADDYTDQTTQEGLANGGIGDINSSIEYYWLSEGLLNYNKTFGQHNISFLGGATWEKFETLTQESYATGFLSDVTNTNLLQSGNVSTERVSSSKEVHTLQSYFGRLNYTYRDKYLFTATVRRDGTSRFSEQNKYAFFPSVAVGWRITQEPFMKNISTINNLKLRLSYGQMGNEGIGDYATIATYVAGGNTVLGGQIVNGAQPARLPNPDLKWETTGEYNFGIDFGLLNDRISGSVEYYIKNTFDQLFNKPVPTTTGFSTILTNFGSVRNSGVDISLTTQNIVGSKFQWTTNLTFSTLKNKVTELPPFIGQIISGGIIANIPGFSLVQQGAPMYAFYGYKVTGIFQNAEQISKSAQPNAKPGWPIFLDANHDGKIDASDRVILGTPYPDFTYSFNNSFSYKNFSLNIFWLGVHGIKTFNGNIVESMFPINFDRNIVSKYYFDRWTLQNPNAGYPSGVNSAVYFGNGQMINSYSIQDASYLRLKDVTLSYKIPLNNTHIFKSIQISFTGENLLTITNFTGFDPAANQTGQGTGIAKSSYNNYPIARVFSLGANVNF